VKTEADGEERCADVMKIDRPDDLVDIANLGLTLAEGKRLLGGLQQEIVAAQARSHAVRRPDCRSCGSGCVVKDYRERAVATLFGQVASVSAMTGRTRRLHKGLHPRESVQGAGVHTSVRR